MQQTCSQHKRQRKRKRTNRTELCEKNPKSHQVKLIITNRPPHSKSQFVLPDELARFEVAEMQLDVIVGHLNEKIPGCILGRSSDSSSPTISNVRISSPLDGGKRRRWTAAAAANRRMPALCLAGTVKSNFSRCVRTVATISSLKLQQPMENFKR